MSDNQSSPSDKEIFQTLSEDEGNSNINTIPPGEVRKQEIHDQLVKRAKQNTDQQKKLADRIFWLLIFQVFFLMLMIVFQAFGWCGFKLNDWVFGFFTNGSLIHTYLLMKQIVTGVYSHEKS